MHQNFISLALLVATILVAALYAYVYSVKRLSYLLFWMAGWFIFGLRYLAPAAVPWMLPDPREVALEHWLDSASGLLFFLGAQIYSRRKPWKIPALTVAVILGLWAAANSAKVVSLSEVIPGSLLYIGVAIVFWRDGRRQENLIERLLGVSFASWGVLWICLHFLNASAELRAPNLSIVAAVPWPFLAVLMIIAVYEEEKRRIERNMLALSNLNLATSSFVGGEIQRMLSQALDRVLGVVRLPAGALFLHHGDSQAITSVVAIGLNDDYCRALQQEGLDDYLIGLVARVGGLLGFRDFRDNFPSALEKEESVHRFRDLTLAQGMRSVVAVSLQAKEQAFGVLLLCASDNRRFTAEELRLLLALGHQIGMAIENSYLIRATSRRSEELYVLNDIGRSLSSTLDKEQLLSKVWHEVRRLFDVENFYIAVLSPIRNEMLFDLEIIDGRRMPKRARPAGNHLTEYIIRTRQPVLIRENYAEETRRLGVAPIRRSGCFCGVPLIAHDHVIGAMAAFSDNERVFDEGHLELMRVLASEASIALENASLFQEERAKASHLALLREISGNVVTRLNADEILAAITKLKGLGLDPTEYESCFISYSSRDEQFAAHLYADLRGKGVRCWFAPEDMKIGDRIRPRIDEAIRMHDKLLLVLTENSVKSAWVEKEVETAFEKERNQGRTVLFPIRLDDAVMEAEEAWAADIRRTRHIGDFCGWKEHDEYKTAFERLMRDLKAEEKGGK